jgi:hypothetical protein
LTNKCSLAQQSKRHPGLSPGADIAKSRIAEMAFEEHAQVDAE